MENFKEWWKSSNHEIFLKSHLESVNNDNISLCERYAEFTWDYCQVKIETLLAALEKYEACRSFYGDDSNWWKESDDEYTFSVIDDEDMYYDKEGNTVGGKLARNTAKDENVIAALKILRGEE